MWKPCGGIRPWFLLVASVVSAALAFAAPSCGGPTYLYPTPTSLVAFQEEVLDGEEMFLVRVQSSDFDACPECRFMATTWEKVAMVWAKKLNLVLLQWEDPHEREISERFFNVRDPAQLPLWLLFHRRNTTVVETEHAPPPGQLDDNESEDGVLGSVGADEGTGSLRSTILPPANKERNAAASPDRRRDDDRRPTTHLPFTTIFAGASGPFSVVKSIVHPLVESAAVNGMGRYMKAIN